MAAPRQLVDCQTGRETTRDPTAAEQAAVAALQAAAATAAQAAVAAQTQRQADLATLKQFAAANPAGPVWQALARLLGAL